MLKPTIWKEMFAVNQSFFLFQLQELQVDRETQLTCNRSLAEESLAQQPRLNNGKLQLADKYRELSNLTKTCWEKQSRLGELISITDA